MNDWKINALWKLIGDEAQSISTYDAFLENHGNLPVSDDSDAPKLDKMTPVLEIVEHILAEKRDHMKALLNLHSSMTKDKPANGTTDFARRALADYRESIKLIK